MIATYRAGLLLALIAGACGDDRAATTVDAIDAPPIDAPVAPITVLFVGNSFTYAWEVPEMVAALAAPEAPIASTSIAFGGATLRDHWQGEARTAIEGGGHDVVVLQGQSLEPVFTADFAPHADLLAGAATAAGARPMFFATWARRAGDPIYADPRTGGSADTLQDRLTAAYADAAARNQAALAPVGEGFRIVLAEHPAILVHHPDGSHASPAGAYLAACVFVEAITDRPATDLERHGLDAPTRAILRDAAHRAVAATK